MGWNTAVSNSEPSNRALTGGEQSDTQRRRPMRSALRRRARTLLQCVALVTASLATSGCYTYHVYQVGGEGGREGGNQPGTEWRHATLHSFAWGAVRQDLPVDNCQLGNGQRFGIEEVKVDTNFGYVLISAATVGIWVPLEVSYRCAKPPVPTDILD